MAARTPAPSIAIERALRIEFEATGKRESLFYAWAFGRLSVIAGNVPCEFLGTGAVKRLTGLIEAGQVADAQAERAA